MDSKPRIQVLDSLRGIAALAVVLFHYSIAYSPSDVLFKFKYGYLGVHLFFIISGFVIYMTLEKTKKPFEFIVSRFSRLFPAYWAAVLLTVLVMFFFAPDIHIGSFQILGNLTMCQHWLLIQDIDGAYWTLGVELSFYAFMFTIFITKGIKFIITISIFLLLCFVLTNILKIPLLGWLFPFFIYSNLFISGMIFYKIRKKDGGLKCHVLILISASLQILISNSITESSFILLIFIVLYLFTFDMLEFLNNKFFLFLGSISYSLYLIHENIGIVLLKYLERFQFPYIFRFSVVLTIVIFVAFLISKFIEKPSMNLIRNRYRNKYQNKIIS